MVAFAAEAPEITGCLFEVTLPLAGVEITGGAPAERQVPMLEVDEEHEDPAGQLLPPVPRQPETHVPLLQTFPEVAEPHVESV